MACQHTGDHVRRSLVREPSRAMVLDADCAEVDLCLDCGEWLSLGPSNDTRDVLVELRAAEIAMLFDESCPGTVPPCGTTMLEDEGWHCAEDDRGSVLLEDTDERMDARRAGWLAHEIVSLNQRLCGAVGLDSDGLCVRCGLEPYGRDCPPGFFDEQEAA